MDRRRTMKNFMIFFFDFRVVLYAMVCGQLPFEDHHTPSLYKKILEGVFKVRRIRTDAYLTNPGVGSVRPNIFILGPE